MLVSLNRLSSEFLVRKLLIKLLLLLLLLTLLCEQDMEIGRQEGSDWAMKEFQQRLRALRGGEEDSPTHTPAKKAKMIIAQGDERVFLFHPKLGAWEGALPRGWHTRLPAPSW
jgi:hypothetical protein